MDEPAGTVSYSIMALPVVDAGRGQRRGQAVLAVLLLIRRPDGGAFAQEEEEGLRETAKGLPAALAGVMDVEEERRAAEQRQKATASELKRTAQQLGDAEERVAVLEGEVEALTLAGQEEGARAEALEGALQEACGDRDLASFQLDLHARVLALLQEAEAELRLRGAAERAAGRAKELLGAAHCTLYVLDPARKELRNALTAFASQPQPQHERTASSSSLGSLSAAAPPSVPCSVGIAGYVARTGETVCVGEAYKDPRFHPSVDERRGAVSHSILSCALRDARGEVLGVLHAINGAEAGFGEREVELVQVLAGPLGPLLARAVQYEVTAQGWRDGAAKAAAEVAKASSAVAEREGQLATLRECQAALEARLARERRLGEVVAAVGAAGGLVEGMAQLEEGLMGLLGVEVVACSVVADDRQALWYPGNGQAAEAKNRMYAGLAGHVVRTGERAVVEEAHKDVRVERLRAGVLVRNVICLPMRDARGEVMGVLEACNRVVDGKPVAFTAEDVELAADVAARLAGVVAGLLVHADERRAADERQAAAVAAEEGLRQSVMAVQAQVQRLEGEVRAAAEERALLEERLERQGRLHRWAEGLAGADTLPALLQGVAPAAGELLRCEQVALLVVDQERDELWTLRVGELAHTGSGGPHTPSRPSQPRRQHAGAVRVPLARAGVAALAVKTGQVLGVPDAARDRPSALGDLPGALGVRGEAALSAPVRDAAGNVVAVLQVRQTGGGMQMWLGVYSCMACFAILKPSVCPCRPSTSPAASRARTRRCWRTWHAAWGRR
jgi:hypothetical protein